MGSEWIYIVEDDESIRGMEQYALETVSYTHLDVYKRQRPKRL